MTDFRTIQLPLDLFEPVEGSFDLNVKQITSESSLARHVRVGGLISQLWECDLKLAPVTREKRQRWEAFKATLEGQATLFIVPLHYGDRLPLGMGAGFAETNDPITITGVQISGVSIIQGDVNATIYEAQSRNQTSVLMQFPSELAGETVLTDGDKFGLGGNLYMCVSNVIPDENGIARVPFRARLWKPALAGDLVDFLRPTVRMQLDDPNAGAVFQRAHEFAEYTMKAREVPFLS